MTSILSPVSLNSPPSQTRRPSPSPSPTTSVDGPRLVEKQVKGLLIPTDRSREELEERWLPKLGGLKVEKEVVLTGYSLYSLRTWWVEEMPLTVANVSGLCPGLIGLRRSSRRRASRPSTYVTQSAKLL